MSLVQDRLKQADNNHQTNLTLAAVNAVPLSRVQLILCRLRLFDFLKGGYRLLVKRPMVCVSALPRGNGVLMCVFQVVTNRPRTERAAIKVTAQYYNRLGRILEACETENQQALFADPIDQAGAQPFYLHPPVDAFWVRMMVQRKTKSRRIAVTGSMRPSRQATNTLTLDQALASRDDFQLRLHLAGAQKSKDRTTACKLLMRLIFLRQMRADQQMLAVVDDVMHVLNTASPAALPAVPTDAMYTYEALFMPPYDGTYKLSKWLAAERSMLMAVAKDAAIYVATGHHTALRLMVATGLNGCGCTENNVDADTLPWLTNADVRAYLDSAQKHA